MFRPPEARPRRYAYAESMTPNLQFGWSAAPQPALDPVQADPGAPPRALRPRRGPGEETNVFDRNPAVASRLTARLDRLMAETSQDAPAPEAADLDKETLERLAALGYVGAPVVAEDVRRRRRRWPTPRTSCASSPPSRRRAR